jgi:biofilm PGA synthesis protein PgaD
MSRSLIIENPELQSNAHRFGWSSVTFFFWMLYIYLWLPLITLVAWWVGAKLFHIQIVALQGYAGVIDKLGLYSAIIVIISAILIGWAKIERFRFKDAVRRVDNTTVPVGDIAVRFKLQELDLTQLRGKKSVIVHFSSQGELASISENMRT